jgi:hypothetical protein
MTQFETLMVETVQDLAREVGANNTMCARLDERLKALEERFDGGAPPVSALRRTRVTAREAGIGATAFVALATSLLQALSSPAAAPAPRAPTHVEAPK